MYIYIHMYICMYVCKYVCIYVYMYVSIHTHISINGQAERYTKRIEGSALSKSKRHVRAVNGTRE